MEINKILIPESVSKLIKQKEGTDNRGTYFMDYNILKSPTFKTYRDDIQNLVLNRTKSILGENNPIAHKLTNSLLSIIEMESRFDPKARRINLDKNKSVDTGLFQINSGNAKYIRDKYNLPEYNPEDYNSQIDYALATYADGGRNRWSSYSNNQELYKQIMGSRQDLTEEESQSTRDLLKNKFLYPSGTSTLPQ